MHTPEDEVSPAPSDSQLISIRAELIKELTDVDIEIDNLEADELMQQQLARALKQQRGGDTTMIKLRDSQLVKLESLDDEKDMTMDIFLEEESLYRESILERLVENIELKKQNKILRAYEHRGVLEESKAAVKDAKIFGGAKRKKLMGVEEYLSSSIFDVSRSMFSKWDELPQDSDGLCRLDVETLLSVFDAAGINLSQTEIEDCFASLSANNVCKFDLSDIVEWYRSYLLFSYRASENRGEGAKLDIQTGASSFSSIASFVGKIFRDISRRMVDFIAMLHTQKAIQERVNTGATLSLTAEDEPNFAETHSSETVRLLQSTEMTVAADTSVANVDADVDKGDYIVDRIVQWQSYQRAEVAPSKMSYRAEFGFIEDSDDSEREEASRIAKASKRVRKKQSIVSRKLRIHQRRLGRRDEAASKDVSSRLRIEEDNDNQIGDGDTDPLSREEQSEQVNMKPPVHPAGNHDDEKQSPSPEPKISVKFELSLYPSIAVKPSPIPFLRKLDKSHIPKSFKSEFQNSNFIRVDKPDEIYDLFSVSPSELLGHFFYTEQTSVGDINKYHNTITWFAVGVKPEATWSEAQLLLLSLKNFFISIPLDERSSMYTEVKGGLFYLASESRKGGKSSSLAELLSAVKQEASRSRVVIIALLHKDDIFRAIEATLPAGLLISRAVRKFSLQLDIMQGLEELRMACQPFAHFEDRLYGPQEDELGEAGMNPLRFAKACKAKHDEVEGVLKRIQTMPLSELRLICKQKGLVDSGTRSELIERVKKAMEVQVRNIGFGEMSAFGKEVCGKIFRAFRSSSDNSNSVRGLSVWDMNELLLRSGSKTIYSVDEYKRTLDDFDIYTEYNKILEDGMIAYYERMGRLAEDAKVVGVGSLNEFAKGQLRCNIEFDSSAFALALLLMGKPTASDRILKKILLFFCSTERCNFDAEYKSVKEMIDTLISLHEDFHFFERESSIFTTIQDILRQLSEFLMMPGGLPIWINKLSEALADGDAGIVRSLRAFLKREYSDDVDDWVAFLKEPLQQWNGELQARQDAAKAAEKEDASESRSFQGEFSSNNDDKSLLDSMCNESTLSCEDQAVDQMTDEEAFENFMQQSLPQLFLGNNMKKADVLELFEEASKLNATLLSSKLDRVQKREIRAAREKLFEKMANIRDYMEKQKTTCAIHACVLYDVFRTFGTGVLVAGFGTKEVDAKIILKGVDNWASYLPSANGDFCPERAELREKIARAAKRKNAALAALFRQRKRSAKRTQQEIEEMEKERLQLLKMKEDKEKEAEEKKLFQTAYETLCSYREDGQFSSERKSPHSVLKLWIKLSNLKVSRYPLTLKAVVCQNNAACVRWELFLSSSITISAEPSRGTMKPIVKDKGALVIVMNELQQCASIVLQQLKEHHTKYITAHPSWAAAVTAGSMNKARINESIDEQATASDQELTSLFPRKIMGVPGGQISPSIFLLQNYLTIVRESRIDNGHFAAPSKLYEDALYAMCSLFDVVSDIERVRIMSGVSKSVNHMQVLSCGDIRAEFLDSLEEMQEILKEEREEEAARSNEVAFMAAEDTLSRAVEQMLRAKMDEVERIQQLTGQAEAEEDLQALHQSQISRQRELDRKKRQITSAQRRKLYSLIRSDEITKIFHEKITRGSAVTGTLQWGKTLDGDTSSTVESDLLFQSMGSLMMGIPEDDASLPSLSVVHIGEQQVRDGRRVKDDEQLQQHRVNAIVEDADKTDEKELLSDAPQVSQQKRHGGLVNKMGESLRSLLLQSLAHSQTKY